MSSTHSQHKPPRWADRFLQFYCSHALIDEIQGDLHEAFNHRVEQNGLFKARLWFIWDVLRFFRPSSFGKMKSGSSQAMYGHYLMATFRGFKRNRIYATINLAGLVVGLSSCLFLALYVQREMSFDRFHPDAERLHRVPMDMYSQGELKTRSATIFAGLGPALQTDFAEVENSVTVSPFAAGSFANSQQVAIKQERVIYATEQYFEMFGYALLDGDPATVLDAPFSAVISQKVARQFFGDADPVGELLKRNGETDFVVTGVMEDNAGPSHMNYDIVLSMKSFDDYQEALEDWGWSDFYCYIKLSRSTDASLFENKLKDYLVKHKQPVFEKYDVKQELWLQPVTGIHLRSDLAWEMEVNGSLVQLRFLMVIGLLILIVVWINFINLSTARAVRRTKEMGMRKVLGARKSQLVQQVILESFLYNLVAVLIAIGVVTMLFPGINQWLGLEMNIARLFEVNTMLTLTVLAITGALITGLYPALILSRLNLQSSVKSTKTRYRKGLVVCQLVVSIVLILGTLMVVRQLEFMRSQPLGMKTAQTLVLEGSDMEDLEELAKRSEALKNNLATIAGVRQVSGANMVPGIENYNLTGFTSDEIANPVSCHYAMVSAGYFESLEVKLVAGRYFDREMSTDDRAVILNESAVRLLNFSSAEEAVGKLVNRGKWSEARIVGIVGDYHQQSLREAVNPMVFFFDDEGDEVSYLFVDLQTENLTRVMGDIEELWESVFPNSPFDYFFLDDFFDRQYQADVRFNRMFIGFTALAIFVACLGLFGLVSFTAEQSKKEISIRKVLGASVSKVVFLLAKDYARLILFAIVIAFPLGYYLMQQWLQGFAYQAAIGVEIFVFGAVIISLIALLTVSFKSFAVANSNPVNALREE